MLYPAQVSWCDREPVTVQEEDNGTVVAFVQNGFECHAALDRMERDMRSTTQFLEGTVKDRLGSTLFFGMTSHGDQGYVSYQPSHLKYDTKGHYSSCPIKWSVSECAKEPQRRFGQASDDSCLFFFQWKGSYPLTISTDHCVPMDFVKLAICEYLANDRFWTGITWVEYETSGKTPEGGWPVRVTRRSS